MLFGRNSVVGIAILDGLLQKHRGLLQSKFNRNEIELGLSHLELPGKRELIVVISIGVLEHDDDSDFRGLARQFEVNASCSLRILDAALANPRVREIHIASSVAALAPRPGFLGYHISKSAFDQVARIAAAHPPPGVSVFVWRFPFIPSPLNQGRKAPPVFRATSAQVSASVASETKPGVRYVNLTQRILAKPLFILGALAQVFRAG